MGTVAIAILAAGRGSRLGGETPKPLVSIGGRSLLSRSLETACQSDLDPVFVVVGYQAEQVIAQLPGKAIALHNPDWEQGIASSLQTALRFLQSDRTIEAVCIGLADQPLIGAAAYRRLAAAYQQGAAIAVATYGGARRNPVLLARSVWGEALQLSGDEGARQLMRTHAVVEVECDLTGTPIDIDTPEDLKNLEINRLLHPK